MTHVARYCNIVILIYNIASLVVWYYDIVIIVYNIASLFTRYYNIVIIVYNIASLVARTHPVQKPYGWLSWRNTGNMPTKIQYQIS